MPWASGEDETATPTPPNDRPLVVLLVCQARFGHEPDIAGARHAAWGITSVAALGGMWAVIAAWRRGRGTSPSASHGSARWGTGEALAGERGLLLGRSERHVLRLDGQGHVLTVAPTRSGKGVSCVIPNLLDYPGSVLVTDPKGENYAVTARWRGAQGHVVHALDPFDVVGGTASYNPMELIDSASTDVADDARLLADMLILPEGREGEQAFWNEEARALLTGLILHVAASAPPELRTLTHVRRLLTLAPDSAQQLLAISRTRGQPEERVLFLLDEFAHLRRMHPVQRDIGLAGGYGVRFWLVLQDLSQLRSTYSETWPTFLANADVLQAFGTNDWDTAEYLSKMTGETTVRVTSENRSTGVSRGMHPHRQYGTAISSAESGRRLLLADEVRRLPSEWELLFVKGSDPLLVRRLNYLTDAGFAARAAPNPLYAPVAAAPRELEAHSA